MNWRGLHISEPAQLSLKQDQLAIQQNTADGTDGKASKSIRTLPLEDIAFLVLDTRQATMTAALLSACADAGCLVIFSDDKHMPNAALLPFHPFHRQAETLEAQIALSEPRKKRLWQSLVQRKIRNQAACLTLMNENVAAQRVGCLPQKVRSGDPDNVEAHAARLYWQAFMPHTPRKSDKGESSDRLNALLNYGYALVRAALARHLAAYGFAPCLGVHHCNRQNAFNLADDLLEPWRPFVDWLAIRHWRQYPEGDDLTRADKQAMTGIFFEPVWLEGERTLLDATAKHMEQLRPYYLGGRNDLPLPTFLQFAEK